MAKVTPETDLNLAKRAFQVDDEFSRDRIEYGTFENMPLALQRWWLDRALRFKARYESIFKTIFEERGHD